MNNTELLKVNEFIHDVQSINPEHAEILEIVRRLFGESCQELSQGIKYGGMVFFQNGELIGGIFPYKKHLSIEFSNGVDFTDPSTLLEGNGKRRRHLKIYTLEDIEAKNTSYFIMQAVEKA